MNYEETTGKSIEQAFTEFHEEHPEVFEQFKKYLNQIIAAEVKRRGFVNSKLVREHKKLKTSSKMILNRIRWEIATVGMIAPNSEENVKNNVYDSFKINDIYTSRYARLFCEQNPDWSFLFNTRGFRS